MFNVYQSIFEAIVTNRVTNVLSQKHQIIHAWIQPLIQDK